MNHWKRNNVFKTPHIQHAMAVFGKLSNLYLWPEVVKYASKIVKRFFQTSTAESGTSEKERKESIFWCEASSISPQVALQNMGFASNLLDPIEQYPEVFSHAQQKVEAYEIPFKKMKLAGSADLTLLYSVLVRSNAKFIVETGVALGWSSLVILLYLDKKKCGRLASVDMPYLSLRAKRSWVGLVVPQRFFRYWKLYRMPDRAGLAKAFKHLPSVDFVHYDSDKSYKGRIWAYCRIWSKLSANGILMSDDIGDNFAWRDFCEMHKIEQTVVKFRGKFIGLARKPECLDKN